MDLVHKCHLTWRSTKQIIPEIKTLYGLALTSIILNPIRVQRKPICELALWASCNYDVHLAAWKLFSVEHVATKNSISYSTADCKLNYFLNNFPRKLNLPDRQVKDRITQLQNRFTPDYRTWLSLQAAHTGSHRSNLHIHVIITVWYVFHAMYNKKSSWQTSYYCKVCFHIFLETSNTEYQYKYELVPQCWKFKNSEL